MIFKTVTALAPRPVVNQTRRNAPLSWWSDSNIRILFGEVHLRMLESEDHQQYIIASRALDLTFACENRGETGSERQIRSTSATVSE